MGAASSSHQDDSTFARTPAISVNPALALPGRVEYVNLWPLAQAEIAGRLASVVDGLLAGVPPQVVGAPKGRAGTAEVVVTGGFPDVLGRTARQRTRYFRSYVQTVLGRDLPDIGQVRVDSSKLEQLLRLLAARTSGLATNMFAATQR